MRRKEEVKHTYQAVAKDYLLALARYPSYSHHLSLENKEYTKLLPWLLKNENHLADDQMPLPSMKEVAKETGVAYGKLAKQLNNIYDDICSLNFNEPHRFIKQGQKLCFVSFQYIGNHATFFLGLDQIPRIEENFDFQFIKPQIGGTSFYVTQVSYEIEDDSQNISISVSHEYPNRYLQLLKEKAYLNHMISLHEYFSHTSLSLEERLRKMYSHL